MASVPCPQCYQQVEMDFERDDGEAQRGAAEIARDIFGLPDLKVIAMRGEGTCECGAVCTCTMTVTTGVE